MAIDKFKVKALCFDVDGTLNDTDDQFAEQAEPFFRAIRRLLPGQDHKRAARRFVMWAEAPGNTLIGLPDRFGFDDQLIKLVSWLNQNHKSEIKHFRPINGVQNMLERLYGKYPMSVVSAREEQSTREFLRLAGIEKYFVCVAGAQTVKHTKPFPDPIFWAARQMGVQAEDCLMIGDTTVDIRAGKAARAQTVGVLCGFGEEAELRRQGADAIFADTPRLADLLL
jgi:phosphoglycolate phosphatase-like HAD superfamily hydrolase